MCPTCHHARFGPAASSRSLSVALHHAIFGTQSSPKRPLRQRRPRHVTAPNGASPLGSQRLGACDGSQSGGSPTRFATGRTPKRRSPTPGAGGRTERARHGQHCSASDGADRVCGRAPSRHAEPGGPARRTAPQDRERRAPRAALTRDEQLNGRRDRGLRRCPRLRRDLALRQRQTLRTLARRRPERTEANTRLRF